MSAFLPPPNRSPWTTEQLRGVLELASKGRDVESLVDALSAQTPLVERRLCEIAVTHLIATLWQQRSIEASYQAHRDGVPWSDIARVTGHRTATAAARSITRATNPSPSYKAAGSNARTLNRIVPLDQDLDPSMTRLSHVPHLISQEHRS